MTIKTDHLNTKKSEDPGYWYIWALSFNTTFRFMFLAHEKFFNKKLINLDQEPPPPSSIVVWHIYAHSLELYMKTFLLFHKIASVQEFKDKKKFGHNLEKLRISCSGVNPKFNNEDLKWITQKIKEFMDNLDWENIKYPNKIPPLFGEKNFFPPLALLDSVVRPLVYVRD